MRKIITCFLLAFILLPTVYAQKNKTGIVLVEGMTKDISVIAEETVGIRVYGRYIIPEATLKAVSPHLLQQKNFSFTPSANLARFNEQAILRAVLEESVEQNFQWLSAQFETQTPLEKLPVFNKRETDAIIFDLDGTLLDSLGAWEHSGSNFLRTQGIEPPAELDAELAQLSLKDGALLVKGMYHLPYTVDEILEATLRPIKDHYYNDIPAKAKVPALLAHLKAQGIKMAVATASHEDFARAALERLGLLDYFEFIITCDEVGVGKRKPYVYERALLRLGGQKSRTVVVEDAPYALQTAHKAKFRTVGVWDAHHTKQIGTIQQDANVFLSFD